MDLEQFIGTLSEEEKLRHKDLIEECRLRGEQTGRICSNCRDALNEFGANLKSHKQKALRSGNNDAASSAVN